MKSIYKTVLFASLILPRAILADGPGGKPQEPDGFKVTVSAGMMSVPIYLGDDDSQILALPNISVRYGSRFTASLRGLEFVPFDDNGWKAGMVLGYNRGREEVPGDSPLTISGDPSMDLVGLGDIDPTIELGGFIEYSAGPFSSAIKLHYGIEGGHKGIVGEANLSYRGRSKALGLPAFYAVGPAITFGNREYNSRFFSVDDEQSNASGLSPYDAAGGIQTIGLHASARVPLSKKISVIGLANYDQLIGEAGDSSIVQERGSNDQYSVGFFVNYQF